MGNCDIKGCDEVAKITCSKCGNEVCYMHTHVVTDDNNYSVFVCEDCYNK
jgi:alpha-D-ribose 1-methylphosphonate 5-phosphate C-P lyase